MDGYKAFELFPKWKTTQQRGRITSFLIKYKKIFKLDELIKLNNNNCIENLNALVDQIENDEKRLYILIDEYDHIVNKLLGDISLYKFGGNEK